MQIYLFTASFDHI